MDEDDTELVYVEIEFTDGFILCLPLNWIHEADWEHLIDFTTIKYIT